MIKVEDNSYRLGLEGSTFNTMKAVPLVVVVVVQTGLTKKSLIQFGNSTLILNLHPCYPKLNNIREQKKKKMK